MEEVCLWHHALALNGPGLSEKFKPRCSCSDLACSGTSVLGYMADFLPTYNRELPSSLSYESIRDEFKPQFSMKESKQEE